MQELWSRTFYGNTVLDWTIALGIMVGAVIAGKAVYWIFANGVRQLTRRTKTKLDDLVLDMVEEPAVFVLSVAGIWYAFTTLELPELATRWIGNLVQLMIALSAAWLLSRLLDAVYQEYLVPITSKTETDLDDQLLPILRKGTKITIWTVGVIVALNNAGYDVGALIAGLGIGGLALAMAAKDTVSNIFGGFTIFTDRPFKLNDRIKVAGFDGVIKEIGVRSTRLETLEGRIVTIPNSRFSDTPVENVSLEPSRKVISNLGLTYDTTPEQMKEAMAILKQVAADNPEVQDNVVTSFTEFGASALNVLFIYYIVKGADVFQVQNDVNLEILTRFAAAKLDFAFPTQTIYTRAG
jgi:MscS family membrane protein